MLEQPNTLLVCNPTFLVEVLVFFVIEYFLNKLFIIQFLPLTIQEQDNPIHDLLVLVEN